MIKLSLLFNSSPSKPKSDPKIFPDAPALLQPPPGSSCQVVHLLSAPQLACWMAKGGGTSSLVYDDGGVLCWQKSCDDGAPLPRELLVVGVHLLAKEL